ncbi:MAG: hypothetical protein EKK64_03185 [Neisseriaceae bacterium]|nr:MAG: hypothetical protein EKK64_03185 [Neisseriaceae bacterium]
MYKKTSDLEFEEEYNKKEELNENEIFHLENKFLEKKVNTEVLRLATKEYTFQEQNLSLAPVIERLRNKKTISLKGICKISKNR